MPMQIRRTLTADNPPSGLAEGQLCVEMASTPPRLWVGVPVAISPSQRVQLNDFATQAWVTSQIAGITRFLPLTGGTLSGELGIFPPPYSNALGAYATDGAGRTNNINVSYVSTSLRADNDAGDTTELILYPDALIINGNGAGGILTVGAPTGTAVPIYSINVQGGYYINGEPFNGVPSGGNQYQALIKGAADTFGWANISVDDGVWT